MAKNSTQVIIQQDVGPYSRTAAFSYLVMVWDDVFKSLSIGVFITCGAVKRDRGQLLGGQEKRGWGKVSLSSQQLAS